VVVLVRVVVVLQIQRFVVFKTSHFPGG